jgi:hypothetical protein
MTAKQEEKIKALIEKYNDILLNSMKLAIAEDLINLIILNRDDSSFELKETLKKKEELNQFILKEFLKLNSSSVIPELREMDERIPTIKKTRKKK